MIYQMVKDANLSVNRKGYVTPKLVRYGALRDLTKSGGSGDSEGNHPKQANQCADNASWKKLCPAAGSDVRLKHNIVQIGRHPAGIGLYLFDYRPEYRDQWGHGRQFGLMAHEVETVMPEAVCVHPDGYKMVDYAMLGVERAIH